MHDGQADQPGRQERGDGEPAALEEEINAVMFTTPVALSAAAAPATP